MEDTDFYHVRALLRTVEPPPSNVDVASVLGAGRRNERRHRLTVALTAGGLTAIVLVGVMADRPALTLRTLALAAFAVLLLAPQAVVHPSFQMSFAATLALIAGYQHGLPWMSGGGKTRLAAKIALWGGREIAGLLLVSLLAGAATIPYIAYHFHRISPYGVIANLVAMPAVSVWVMPAGILGG